MRTHEYGKITEFRSLSSSDGFLNIPIKLQSTTRWIAHVLQSVPKYNGNSGSALIALIDNFGDVYYFEENALNISAPQAHILKWNIDDNGGTNSKNIYEVARDGGLPCNPKKSIEDPFMDKIIDLLKFTICPDSADSDSRKKIDQYLRKLKELNKSLLNPSATHYQDFNCQLDMNKEKDLEIDLLKEQIKSLEEKLFLGTKELEDERKKTVFLSEMKLPVKPIVPNCIEITTKKITQNPDIEKILQERITKLEEYNKILNDQITCLCYSNKEREKDMLKYHELKSDHNNLQKKSEDLQKRLSRCHDTIESLELYIADLCSQNDDESKWQSHKDLIEGKIKETEEFYILDLLYEDTSKYSGFQVMGSWDDWQETYDMVHSSDRYSIYLNSMPLYGKHHYKLKKNGEWIEPTENDLREKDADGNWNFVLFIHN